MDNLHGTWALIETAATDCDGRPLDPPYGGPAALGRVTFGRDGRMVAVICDGRAEPPAGAPRAYMSYCGRFTYDGETLITRVDAAGDPARLGTDQVRKVHFEGETMVLTPPAATYDGVFQQRVLKWRRIAAE
ncbi:MAG: lipocalin-like domain-containing protein [Alphaproteobacteria bacterium]|nr:lipocalin-like domain-containing protein [Alphaproteobacteria bacterium]MEC7571837.1 lipocalin-like domain-containing protein [Pseudomonadota bacterium]MEC9175016.1 lipocalin-like domain-containing protein [Pseudomonadota bacterium]MED5365394.1 lipocalin-like domain-containing protein [Pseudomonadota bacterium]MEE3049372.1 lipocalin-like domain-containing protein [Pseudomonadota bacterium]